MQLQFFFTHLVFGLFLFGISTLTAWTILKRSRVIDNPCYRSSHSTPIPTTGGLAIVFTFFLGMLIYAVLGNETMILSKYFLGFTFSSLLIAGISYYDDLKDKPLTIRLATHTLGILTVMGFGIVINRIEHPLFDSSLMAIAGYFLTFMWILGLTNAYNFMDGLNGMAGCNAVITAIFLCIISFSQGSNFTYIVCYTIVAGTGGFLIFNYPKGKLFMGDVGSTFLGFTFAVLAIISALYDNSHTSLMVMPLLLFHFIFDTFFTFMRRGLSRENVFMAHRTHIYQLLNRLGMSHTRVTFIYMVLCIIQGMAAKWMLTIGGPERTMVFLPFALTYFGLAMVVVKKARRKGILG
ncbi:MAG: undecaprenyl/decaprenyl-phosphate alpha-N-acetylglucosaminyl 1-phosphate transferase [Desulfobacterales bacterium]|nr:undecaprenyl/decaprenyl-phosphate alpha-N-acetylglucosaminyl 1-phosphate transferase [Desulfobacterales bacterium]